MPIFGQKTSILLKLHYFMVIKVTRMPFLFRFFTKKSLLSWKYFIKNTYILKKTHCSHAHISQKNVHSLKNTVLSCIFFSIFSWKTSAVVHMIGQKTSILSKLHSILGQKSHRMPFFPISHEKISALMSIFCQKNVHSQKRNSSHLHVLSKKRPLS